MLSTEGNIFMIMMIGEFIIGIFANGYIGLVVWIDWIKKKKTSPVDCILASLAISRMCLLCITIPNGIILVLCPEVYLNNKTKGVIRIFQTLITI